VDWWLVALWLVPEWQQFARQALHRRKIAQQKKSPKWREARAADWQ
jgi:hypothetical protein